MTLSLSLSLSSARPCVCTTDGALSLEAHGISNECAARTQGSRRGSA